MPWSTVPTSDAAEACEFGVHPEAEAAGFDKMTTIVEIELNDGTTVKGSADWQGESRQPMTDAELADKFRNARAGRSMPPCDAVIGRVWHIEDLHDVGELDAARRGYR
jgi:hypothetical protein